MKLLKSSFLVFVKNKICLISYFLLNVVLIGSWIRYSGTTAFRMSEVLLELTSIVFIVNLFISFLYFSNAKKCDLDECISTSPKGKILFAISQFAVVLIMSLITFLLVFVLSVIGALKNSVAYSEYIFYLLKASFLYFFLADIIAILIGLICSQIKKSAISYIILILCAVLFSPLTNRLPNIIFMANENINTFPYFKVFEIYPKSFSHDVKSFGYAATSHSLWLMLVWIAMLLIITVLIIAFRNQYIKLGSALVFVLIFSISVVNYNSPYCEKAHDMSPFNGYPSTIWHYLPTDNASAPMQYNEKSNFKIKSYDMHLHIKNYLSGLVHVYIEPSDIKDFKFTLYHDYTVTDISDSQGRTLEFDREGDYITIHTKYKTDMLTFTYSGGCSNFWSNTQGTNLPGGFAYYPIPGHHYVFDVARQCTISCLLDAPVKFSVEIQGNRQHFCNLEKISENRFEGVTDGVTLVSGFYKELTYNSTRLVYPYLEQNLFEDASGEAALKAFLEEYPEYKGTTIILTESTSNFVNVDQCCDHINAISLYEVDRKPEPSKKIRYRNLDVYYAFMKYYDKNSELYKLTQKNSDELTDDNDLNTVLAKKILEYKSEAYSYMTNALSIDSSSENMSEIDIAKSIGLDDAEEQEG